jgi:hypothetical protein
METLKKEAREKKFGLWDALLRLRGQHLGQDRFYRHYWVLPSAGGVFVEALESGMLDKADELRLDEEEWMKTNNPNNNNKKEELDMPELVRREEIKMETITGDDDGPPPLIPKTEVDKMDTSDSDRPAHKIEVEEEAFVAAEYSPVSDDDDDVNSCLENGSAEYEEKKKKKPEMTIEMNKENNAPKNKPTPLDPPAAAAAAEAAQKVASFTAPVIISSPPATAAALATAAAPERNWFSILPRIPCDPLTLLSKPATLLPVPNVRQETRDKFAQLGLFCKEEGGNGKFDLSGLDPQVVEVLTSNLSVSKKNDEAGLIRLSTLAATDHKIQAFLNRLKHNQEAKPIPKGKYYI